jgi:hypothetical protein
MKGAPCVVAAAEHAGWAHLLCVGAAGDCPMVIERRRVSLIDDGLPCMPYHHETLRMAVADADALIARVRRSIAAHALAGVQRLAADLAPARTLVALAIREPPFADLPDSVASVRQSYRLQCSADGMMYQLALCHASRELGLGVHLFRRGDEARRAAERVGVTSAAIESFVNGPGRPPGPPWTGEHRRGYAAAIAVLADFAHGRLTVAPR